MSYASYFKGVAMPLPQGMALVVGGLYLYVNVFNGRPGLWTRQASKPPSSAGMGTNGSMQCDHAVTDEIDYNGH